MRLPVLLCLIVGVGMATVLTGTPSTAADPAPSSMREGVAPGPRVVHARYADGTVRTTWETALARVSVVTDVPVTIGQHITYDADGAPTVVGSLSVGKSDPRARTVRVPLAYAESTRSQQSTQIQQVDMGCKGRSPLRTVTFRGVIRQEGNSHTRARYNGILTGCRDAVGRRRVWVIEKMRMSAIGGRDNPHFVWLPDPFWMQSSHLTYRRYRFLDQRPTSTRNAGGGCKQLSLSIAGQHVTLGVTSPLCEGKQHPIFPNPLGCCRREYGTKFDGSKLFMHFDRWYTVAGLGWVQADKFSRRAPFKGYRASKRIRYGIDLDSW